MKAQAPTPPAKKGIIVCDSSGLLPLMAPLPLEAIAPTHHRNDPIPTVFDGLLFLAQHGYEVIIPEMIAYEMGDYMRDGENAHNRYFPNGRETKLIQALSYRSFFREIADLESKGVPIHIQPPRLHDTSEEASFLNTIYRIHTSDTHDSEKRAALCKLGHLPRGGHVGSKQLKDYVDHLPLSDTPIYVLSNTANMQKSFAERSDVKALGTSAFYNALKREGFLARLGIEADALRFDQNFHDYYARFHISLHHTGSPHTDAISGYHLGTHAKPFAAEMKLFSQAIKEQEATQTSAPEATIDITDSDYQGSTKPLSPVEKFNQRFGGRK